MDSRAATTAESAINSTGAARIITCYPTRAFFAPGEDGEILVRVAGRSADSMGVRGRLTELDRTISSTETVLGGEEQVIHIPLPAPPGHGYGVEVALIDPLSGETRDRRRTALDVQAAWFEAPRYGFLCGFSPGRRYDRCADQLLERHITVVQFYDWMYRHYRYLPPSDTYADALGRSLSLSSVRSAIAALRDRGIAALAYGSVYGAEPEYALQHPEELLYDQAGVALSLEQLFYLQDVRPGPWRRRVLDEYRQAVRSLRFNGIHADHYGHGEGQVFPELARDVHGNVLEIAPALAEMVRAAQEAVVEAGGDGVIFNCVNNWPIHEVAPQPQLCTYIEVWPPHIRLQDLSDLVAEARQLAPERQVILAAYMSCAASSPDAGEAATMLTSSVIHASGGFHLLLGEGTGMLVDPYYPRFVRPTRRFQQRIVEHWDFIVRYGSYLYDRSLRFMPSSQAQAEGLWAIWRSTEAFDTLSLINAQPADPWNALREAPSAQRDIRVELPFRGPVARVVVASPDGMPNAVPVAFERSDATLRFTVPRVDTWTLAVILH